MNLNLQGFARPSSRGKGKVSLWLALALILLLAGSLVAYYSAQSVTNQSQATTESSTGCGTTADAAGNATDDAFLFGNFSSMSIDYNTSEIASNFKQTGGLTSDFVYTYHVVASTPTGYAINITENGTWGGEPRPEGSTHFSQTYTARTTRNGSFVALETAGANYSCSEDAFTFAGLMSMFGLASNMGGQLAAYTLPDHFHVASQENVVMGDSSLSVVNYAADFLPVAYSYENMTVGLTHYALQVGTLSGTRLRLVTFAHLDGTQTTPDGSTKQDFTMRLLSVTRV